MTQGMHTISRLLVFQAVFIEYFYFLLFFLVLFMCFFFKCGLLAVRIKNYDDSKIYKIHICAALSHSDVKAWGKVD